jgi:Tol biopolymer transport system component
MLLLAGCNADSRAQTIGTPSFLASGSGFEDYWPCFSPDGKSILFSRHYTDVRNWQLWIVSLENKALKKFAGEAVSVSATRANWSADNRIAFTGPGAPDKSNLWVMSADGTNLHPQPTETPIGPLFYPSWVANQNDVIVVDGRDLTLKRIDLGSGAVTPLTDRSRILAGKPSVSPDGKSVAFAGQVNHGQRYDQQKNIIWLLDVGSGAVHSLEATPKQGRAPAWSPNGNRIAFESNRDNPLGRYAVFIVNRDGTGLRQITDYAINATNPVWSPDARRMAFSATERLFSADMHIGIVDVPPAN